jgi:hypothetical protein
MKSGVRKAYRNLCSWRSKYATKHLQCTLPHLTIQHIIDAIPLYLSCKDLCHVNPSVIFSCLLHLAYERDRDGDRNRANLDQVRIHLFLYWECQLSLATLSFFLYVDD